MTAGFYVRIPQDLAECVSRDGFRIAGTERGTETLLGDSANLVTVLVGAHEISRFVGHLWASARHGKPKPVPGSKVIIERDGRRVAIVLEHDGFGDEGPPPAVVEGMTALFSELAGPDWLARKHK